MHISVIVNVNFLTIPHFMSPAWLHKSAADIEPLFVCFSYFEMSNRFLLLVFIIDFVFA